jgi:hypothetical protein
MKSVAYAIALTLALAGAVGCGSSMTSEGPPQGRSEGTSTQENPPSALAPGTTDPEHGPSGNHDHGGTSAAAPLPRGVPLEAKDPRVQRAITGLLNPKRTSRGQRGSSDDIGSSHDKGDKHRGGVLAKIIGDLRRNATQLQPDEDHPNQHEDGLKTILELLK